MLKSLADHGVRKYEDFSGRFTSPDPLWEKYYGWSPYVYSLNNPIRLKDDNGLLPGDPFKSATQAAHDFGKNYNPLSIKQTSEFGATIYETTINGKKIYSYSVPEKGDNDGTNVIPAPDGTKEVADVHSHGAYESGYKNNEISPGDKTDNDNKKVNGYIVTPNGSLIEYNVKLQQTKVKTIDLPSDPKDPDRKNDVKPEKTETRKVPYIENGVQKNQ